MQNLNDVQNKHFDFAQNSAHGNLEEIMENFGFGSNQLKRVKGTVYCVYFKSPGHRLINSAASPRQWKERKQNTLGSHVDFPHKEKLQTNNLLKASNSATGKKKKHPKLCFVFFWEGSWWPGTDEDLAVQGNILERKGGRGLE